MSNGKTVGYAGREERTKERRDTHKYTNTIEVQ